MNNLGIWCQLSVFIDQSLLRGWCGQYHAGCILLPMWFPDTQFRLGWPGSLSLFIKSFLKEKQTHDYWAGSIACQPLCYSYSIVNDLVFINSLKPSFISSWCIISCFTMSHNPHCLRSGQSFLSWLYHLSFFYTQIPCSHMESVKWRLNICWKNSQQHMQNWKLKLVWPTPSLFKNKLWRWQ